MHIFGHCDFMDLYYHMACMCTSLESPDLQDCAVPGQSPVVQVLLVFLHEQPRKNSCSHPAVMGMLPGLSVSCLKVYSKPAGIDKSLKIGM